MVLVILIIILVTSETHSCNIKVCLTWSAIKNEITFKCRVNALSWQVKFFNQFHKEQAYCMSPIPFSHCYPLSTNCTITQDALRNITMLTVRGRIDNSINGGWTCYHGTNVDKAVVNVTVLREAIPLRKPYECCWEKNTVWTFFGFLIAFVVLYIIHCIRKVKGTKRKCTPSDQCVNRVNSLGQQWKGNCKSSIQCTNKSFLLVFKLVMFCLLITILISLPLLLGFKKVGCSAQYAFIAFGIIMGFLVSYLLVTEKGIICCQQDNNDAIPSESDQSAITNVEPQQDSLSVINSPEYRQENDQSQQDSANDDETVPFKTLET